MDDFLDKLQHAPVAGFIFLVTLVTSAYDFTNQLTVRDKFIFNPYRILVDKEYYRLVTAGLVHGDWVHLAFNMLTYYFFAFRLEQDYMPNLKFLSLYLFSLVASNLALLIKYKNQPHYQALGASGAISGVLFSFILFYPFADLGIFFFIPMKAWLFALLYVGFSYFASLKKFGNVAHEAHLWGAIAGFLYTAVLYPDAAVRFWQYVQYYLSFK